MAKQEAGSSLELNQPESADMKKPSVANSGIDTDVERRNSFAIGEVVPATGTTRIEAMRIVWGRHGLKIMWTSIILMLIVYQFDNALMYNYRNYAASLFDNVAGLSTLGVIGNIIFAVFKPPIAKLSDVVGRGETYAFCICCYLLGYILCASSPSFGAYSGGFIFANIGQTGANIMNDIVISDISSMRWRGFAISASFIPFFITPWISGFIVEDVVADDGAGWRWGIGMFAIIMPFTASFIIGSLLFYQRKAKKQGLVAPVHLTLKEFCSRIDIVGSVLLAGGFAMFLIPFSLGSAAPSRWSTGWIIALIVLGVATLVALIFYEQRFARFPILPARYLKSLSIVLCCLIAALDQFGFQATHTYLYTWAVITHDAGPRLATFFNYTNGVVQAVVALIGGYVMYKTRSYKWLMVAGAIVKLIAYGAMLRLRGSNNSWAELFLVQAIQGVGSGLVEIIVIVGAQVVVPHAEMPQVTALVLLFAFVGAAIGNAVAGGIYTGTFKPALRTHLGSLATDEIVDAVYTSITAGTPADGSAERAAVNVAYSDVLRYITYTAVATSIVVVALTLAVPNIRLPETVDPYAREAAQAGEEAPREQDNFKHSLQTRATQTAGA